jgi:hypothetical protein
MANEKTFSEKHAAAMVCHRREYREGADRCSRGEAFAALADYADELAAKVAELEEEEEEEEEEPEFSTIAQCQAWRRGERPRTYTADELDGMREDAWDERHGLPGGIAAR